MNEREVISFQSFSDPGQCAPVFPPPTAGSAEIESPVAGKKEEDGKELLT